jgi:aryl-alcohol dehydrogenase-like predicted oxidoreductase
MSFPRNKAGLERTPDADGPAVAAAAAAGRMELGGALMVNRLGFGAMRLARPGIPGGPRDQGEPRRVVRRAVQLGVGFIDTARGYRASDDASGGQRCRWALGRSESEVARLTG